MALSYNEENSSAKSKSIINKINEKKDELLLFFCLVCKQASQN